MPTNSATSATKQTRYFSIDDEGDAFNLALFEDGVQVGGGYFPEGFGGDPFALALEVGESFAGPCP